MRHADIFEFHKNLNRYTMTRRDTDNINTYVYINILYIFIYNICNWVCSASSNSCTRVDVFIVLLKLGLQCKHMGCCKQNIVGKLRLCLITFMFFVFLNQNLEVFSLFCFQNFKKHKTYLVITICRLFFKMKNTK